ncbi:prolyl aminopeptidase [Roseospira navarrensis]|uniref:Proline iminopeptidase n=1 Tax=Roseospira navarrensis TaxID=140058 RepID=A0A7X1ZDY0_9PROT|nr:prolyl aminopeptidase [Roseospira navarrensis]MQX36573.1 prolyl aminopeptidase [Roseospira navarrensis]
MTDLHPPIDPFESGVLDVGDGHSLYWEQCGAPDGVPVLFLHGGPGAGIAPSYRRFFNPTRHRAVLFDQRGCGRSAPRADITANTTWHLVADIERLREHLGIARWHVVGGSWGSTLALAYGQAHPEHCLGFVLRGIFLFRAQEVDWFLNGMGVFFPEARAAFLDFLPEEERASPLESYYRRLCDPHPSVHGPAAVAWSRYEESCSRLVPRLGENSAAACLPLARMEAHYMMHHGFMDEAQLLRDVGRIAHLPATLIQGRYDMVCPPVTAQALHQAWPGSRLDMVPDAGHAAMEPGIRRAIVRALARLSG